MTAVLVALAILVLGFGHQHAPAAPSDKMLAAYLQMGGSLDELCVEQEGPRGVAQDCPVCTLASCMALSPPLPQSSFSLGIATLEFPRAGDLLARGHTPRAPPARGPPTAFV